MWLSLYDYSITDRNQDSSYTDSLCQYLLMLVTFFFFACLWSHFASHHSCITWRICNIELTIFRHAKQALVFGHHQLHNIILKLLIHNRRCLSPHNDWAKDVAKIINCHIILITINNSVNSNKK